MKGVLTTEDLATASEAERRAAKTLAQGLSERYEEYLDSRVEPPRRGGVHASEVSKCLRRLVYSLHPGPRPSRKISRTWRRKFQLGHAVHDMLQKSFHHWARSSGYLVQFLDEVPIEPHLQKLAGALNINSNTDGVFSLRDPDTLQETVRVLLEIKSINGTDFKSLTAPYPDHVEQAHVYMACLRVPYVWMLYWDKATHAYTPSHHPAFLLEFDPAIWAELEDRIVKAHAMAEDGVLPDRSEGIHCEFCPWSGQCDPKFLRRSAEAKPTVLSKGLSKRRL